MLHRLIMITLPAVVIKNTSKSKFISKLRPYIYTLFLALRPTLRMTHALLATNKITVNHTVQQLNMLKSHKTQLRIQQEVMGITVSKRCVHQSLTAH